MDTLKELGHFFLETEKHHKREEEALFPRLEAHRVFSEESGSICKEDNILYPMALKTLQKGEGEDVRKKFDAIGYCCLCLRIL